MVITTTTTTTKTTISAATTTAAAKKMNENYTFIILTSCQEKKFSNKRTMCDTFMFNDMRVFASNRTNSKQIKNVTRDLLFLK